MTRSAAIQPLALASQTKEQHSEGGGQQASPLPVLAQPLTRETTSEGRHLRAAQVASALEGARDLKAQLDYWSSRFSL
jgi:hypothetical protein